MKRADMVCSVCLKFDAKWVITPQGTGPVCRCFPKPYVFTNDTPPHKHWCASGVWRDRIPGMNTAVNVYWDQIAEDEYVMDRSEVME